MNDSTIGKGTGENAFTPVEQLTYEAARKELEEIVRILELGQMNLDESLKYWERGEALAKFCEDQLAGARQRIENAINAANPGAQAQGASPAPNSAPF